MILDSTRATKLALPSDNFFLPEKFENIENALQMYYTFFLLKNIQELQITFPQKMYSLKCFGKISYS